MRKNALIAMLLLISTGVLTAGYERAPREPVSSINRIRLSPYGTVLNLPGRNGGVTSLQYEGYALTYRFKRPGTGRQETRFLYAFGGQHASSSLLQGRVQGPTATLKTRDGLLQITTTVECDERKPCRLTRNFKNTSRDESMVIEVVQAEAMIDAKSLSDNTYRGAYLNDRQGCSGACPGPPCGGWNWPPCEPPGFGAYLPPFPGYAGITSGMPFRVAGLDQTSPKEVAILTWLEGVNAKFEVLRFGQSQRMVTVP